MASNKLNRREGERGVVVILMAFGIIFMLGCAAFAIDFGRAFLAKSELRNVSDAASLAATRQLALIYQNLPSNTDFKTYQLSSSDLTTIRNKAIEVAAANKAAGSSVTLNTSDIVVGTYNAATGALTAGSTGVRAVQVKARRDGSANGAIPTTVARVIGTDSLSVAAQSGSAISAMGLLRKGKGDIPVGIAEDWFKTRSCAAEADNEIIFNPTNNSCAGWHTFDDPVSSASRLEAIMDGMAANPPSFVSPETTAGVTSYNFTGGDVSSKFSNFDALYKAKRDASGKWKVNIPVYKGDCSNPNQARLIVGFAQAMITKVNSDLKTIEANVICGVVDASVGRGGGEIDFGTLVGSPGMIR